MTNEQFETINGHLGSIALSLKEIATFIGEFPLPTGNSSPEKPTHKGWRAHVIHFGKQKGEALGDISEKSLEWWIGNYRPKPYIASNGDERPPGKLDTSLRNALDEAATELGKSQPRPDETPRAPSPAPAPQQEIQDEDVPF